MYRGVRDVRVEDVPDCEAGPGDIVVAVRACGICGSDLHSYEHGSFVAPGQVMGHELAGEVVEVGSAVDSLELGDRVTAVPIVPCERCARCSEGRTNLCDAAWTQALAYGRPGAFAERLLVPNAKAGENVFTLPDDVDDDAGATAEPLAVAVHGVRLAGEVRGCTALVLGLGAIGQQVAQVLKSYGARRVLGVDRSPLRRDVARRLGVSVPEDAADVDAALATVLGEREEIDLVFECSGVAALAKVALRVVRSGGAVVALALYEDPVTFNPTALVQKEVRLQGAIAYTSADFEEAVRLLAAGAVAADPLITHRMRLEDVGAAFEAQRQKDRSLKVLVRP